MAQWRSLLAAGVATLVSAVACGRDAPPTPFSPSPLTSFIPTPSLMEESSLIRGSVALSALHFGVVSFRVDRPGDLSSRVDWASPSNDIDTALLRGRCTVALILAESADCDERALMVSEESLDKPSVFSLPLDAGEYTLVILNVGPGTETVAYGLEGYVSEATPPATSPVEPSPAPSPTPTPAPSPTPAPTPAARCPPALIQPAEGAVLDNGRVDSRDATVWEFDWSDCVQATEYHLHVIRTGATFPVVNQTGLTQSSYRYVRCGSYIADANRSNWTWRVRARVGGIWGSWTAFRRFEVEPANSDPPQECR